ncbi:hypothetical protein LCGC14_0458900 [marine sediment metagenome]|uniref:Uncharacterized protein n=1 Tax=marine sediment metagenome TaxID=412755 RepID=A0A0F9SYL9_9ZZZZ
MKKESAANAYIESQMKARNLIEKLEKYLDNHQEEAPVENVHWGHVGDINRIVENLNDTV